MRFWHIDMSIERLFPQDEAVWKCSDLLYLRHLISLVPTLVEAPAALAPSSFASVKKTYLKSRILHSAYGYLWVGSWCTHSAYPTVYCRRPVIH